MPLSEECKCVLASVDAAMGLLHKNAVGKAASKGFTQHSVLYIGTHRELAIRGAIILQTLLGRK